MIFKLEIPILLFPVFSGIPGPVQTLNFNLLHTSLASVATTTTTELAAPHVWTASSHHERSSSSTTIWAPHSHSALDRWESTIGGRDIQNAMSSVVATVVAKWVIVLHWAFDRCLWGYNDSEGLVEYSLLYRKAFH